MKNRTSRSGVLIFENWLFRGFFAFLNSQQTDDRGDTSRKESQISVRITASHHGRINLTMIDLAQKREIFEHEADGFSQTKTKE